MTRRSYSGTAVPTILASGIGALDLAFTVQDATGYPDGSAGPFFVTLARGIAGEEKILCDSRSGTSFTVNATGRGADGTVATSHAASSTTVEHTITKTDLDEANAHVNDTTGDPHPQYLTPAEGSAAYVAKAGGDTITASGASVIPLVVKGAAGQTAALLEGRTDAATLAFSVTPGGDVQAAGAFQSSGESLHTFGSPTDFGARVSISTTVASAKGLVLRCVAAQTGNALEVQSSAAAVLVAVTPAGKMQAQDFEFLAAVTNTVAPGGGAAGALPANPVGYLRVVINGTVRKIPFYEDSV